VHRRAGSHTYVTFLSKRENWYIGSTLDLRDGINAGVPGYTRLLLRKGIHSILLPDNLGLQLPSPPSLSCQDV
jgi:hypothetical protein